MTVLQLIEALEQMPQYCEVMIDRTGEDSEMFHFTELTTVSDIETALGENVVLLSTVGYEDDASGMPKRKDQLN